LKVPSSKLQVKPVSIFLSSVFAWNLGPGSWG
jgi:hypothetical protein